MIYTISMTKQGVEDDMTSSHMTVPMTVQDLTATSESEEAITVLDLSNPRDVAMVTEAGYNILDLSASMQSTDSNGASSDTMSMVTDDMSDIDPEIAKAAMQSAESGSLIPIIKEELKCRIQTKRLRTGKGLLQVEVSQETDAQELTPEEQARRDRRRERNKLAAQKCRSKRRVRADILEQESNELINKNDNLKDEIEKLEAEREMLTNMLRTHDLCPRTCNTRLSACSDNEDDKIHELVVPNVNELGVELEVEIGGTPPVSPFCVNLIDNEHQDMVFAD